MTVFFTIKKEKYSILADGRIYVFWTPTDEYVRSFVDGTGLYLDIDGSIEETISNNESIAAKQMFEAFNSNGWNNGTYVLNPIYK